MSRPKNDSTPPRAPAEPLEYLVSSASIDLTSDGQGLNEALFGAKAPPISYGAAVPVGVIELMNHDGEVVRQFMPKPDAPREHLPAALVIGGLWETAPVVATMPGLLGYGAGVNAVVHGPDGPDHWLFGIIGERHEQTTGDGGQLSLRLPGPRGCGLHGLKMGIRARITDETKSVDPPWFLEAFGQACLDGRREEWLSRYLCMTDNLAGSRGWPAGPGAPVYGWRQLTRLSWLLTRVVDQLEKHALFTCSESIIDPMEALEDAWKQECAR